MTKLISVYLHAFLLSEITYNLHREEKATRIEEEYRTGSLRFFSTCILRDGSDSIRDNIGSIVFARKYRISYCPASPERRRPSASSRTHSDGPVSQTLLTSDFNPLPHGVLASFHLTAGGLPRPPKEGDISTEKTILMTSLRVWYGLHEWVENNFSAPPPPSWELCLIVPA